MNRLGEGELLGERVICKDVQERRVECPADEVPDAWAGWQSACACAHRVSLFAMQSKEDKGLAGAWMSSLLRPCLPLKLMNPAPQ